MSFWRSNYLRFYLSDLLINRNLTHQNNCNRINIYEKGYKDLLNWEKNNLLIFLLKLEYNEIKNIMKKLTFSYYFISCQELLKAELRNAEDKFQ